MEKQIGFLIPTLPQRIEPYSAIINELYKQISESQLTDHIQLLTFGDSREMSVGEKRNWLIDMSYRCKYIQFIDDDDKVSEDFVKSIYDASLEDSDVITFKGEYHKNGNYVADFVIHQTTQDINTKDALYRKPNHISCVKRIIAAQCKFPNQNYNEDSAYADQINAIIKTSTHIDKKLYYYMYDDSKSMTAHSR